MAGAHVPSFIRREPRLEPWDIKQFGDLHHFSTTIAGYGDAQTTTHWEEDFYFPGM